MVELKKLMNEMTIEYEEKRVSLNEINSNISDYEEAQKIKDKKIIDFIIDFIFYATLISLVVFSIGFGAISIKILLEMLLIEYMEEIKTILMVIDEITNLVASKITVIAVPICGLAITQIKNKKELKKYKQNGSKYNELTKEEINNILDKLYQKKHILEADIRKIKPIIEYLKLEIVKKKNEPGFIKGESEKNIDINLVKKIDYKDIHLKEYEIPKVKVKTRNEKGTRL